MSDDMIKYFILPPLLFWVGMFYVVIVRFLIRTVRRLAGHSSTPARGAMPPPNPYYPTHRD